MGNYPKRWMNHKLANDMKKWKGNGNTTTLLFSLKRLKFYIKKEKETIVIEHFNGILSHKSRLANKQHTNHSHSLILNL